MASENCAPGWPFSAALVNHCDGLDGILRNAVALLVEGPHHGHGARIAAIGERLGYLEGVLVALVLEQGDGLFKAALCLDSRRRCHKQHGQHHECRASCRHLCFKSRESVETMRRASSALSHISSSGRMKSGFCGSNMSRSPGSTGS